MTPNKEDYLKCIYELSQNEEKMTNKQIAALMQVSAPAVSEMVKKLVAEEWIHKDSLKGYCLTETGQALVAALYRKHRLLEVFLVHHLHYTTDEIHEEAEILEHTVSDAFIDRLEAFLDYPQVCPHGGSIPKKDQLLIERYQSTLAQVTQTGHYQLVRTQDFYQLLQYLEQHELVIGDAIELTAIDPFAQTFHVHYKGRQLTIPTNIAQQMYVEALPTTD